MKNYSIQSFKECLLFIFWLFCFVLWSNNTLHLIFCTYICYWNTFQYKYIVVKQLCASEFKRYLFIFYHTISFSIFVLSRHRLISWSSPPTSLFNWPCVQLYLKVSNQSVRVTNSSYAWLSFVKKIHAISFVFNVSREIRENW